VANNLLNQDCEKVKKYMLEYVVSKELTGETMEDKVINAVGALKDNNDFPVAIAKSISVIKAAFLEARQTLGRHSRSQSKATAVSSRAASPTKGAVRPRSELHEDSNNSSEGEEDRGPVRHGQKRKREISAGTSTRRSKLSSAIIVEDDDE